MATNEIDLRTKPRYWTAAVWQKVPGRGLIFQGYMPAVNATWPKFLDRLMQLPRDRQTRSYHWDGRQWKLDHNSVIGADLIGAIERRSPLPPGRYWQDIFNKQAPDWNAWVAAHASGSIGDTSKDVVIEKVERFRRDPLRDGSWLPEILAPENAGTIPDRMWVLFRVQRPVPWPATKLGFPTIAEGVQSSADTAENPPGPTPGEELEDAAMRVVRPVLLFAGGLLAIKVLLSSFRK